MKVWWVQSKPFVDEKRHSEEAEKFQRKCRKELFFGIGWAIEETNKYAGQAYSEAIASELKSVINSSGFTRAQNVFGNIKKDDLVLSRLNDRYWLGRVQRDPFISEDTELRKKLTWCSKVEEWIDIGARNELPAHVMGKLSSRKYHGTAAEIDGMAGITLMMLAGIEQEPVVINENNFHEVLGSEDLEDLMADYMRSVNQNYVVLPSSCKHDTPTVEFVMYNKDTNEKITCQTKIDRSIDICQYVNEKFYKMYKKIYLFSGKEDYCNIELKTDNIIIVEKGDMYDTLKKNVYFKENVERFFVLS